ncbi:MAG TPA: DNA cytosine methyltransferase [Streptosporangiaceae bacterium]|nr:DNA cytosine methyltransferase [Streptosporangiaceae bacterium]
MAQYGVRLQRSDALKLSAHPEGPTVRTLPTWCDKQRADGRPIAVDLFSGAGGLSAGVEAAGWVIAAAVDHDPRALETHRHNFPGLALDLDLGEQAARETFSKLFKDIPVDLVAGGPPCQPFSRAGRSKIRSLVEAGARDAVDHRRELWSAFLDMALRLEPRAILMENVPDMALGDGFRVIRTMVDSLEKVGYATKVQLTDAWRFGVPQHRKRLILLARRDGHGFSWPAEQPAITTLRDSIGDLPKLGATTGAREMAYVAARELSAFGVRMREGATLGVLHDHMTRAVRADDLEVFQLMDSKTLYSSIPEHLRRYKADSFDDKYKRLDWDDVSRSITAHIAKDGYWYIHPGEHRTLTVREAARIQTFPDAFRFSGGRSDAFRQIGNAVPPLLGEAAALALVPRCGASESKPTNWLAARKKLTKWAEKQRSAAYWFMLPGPAVTPPVALAAAVTSGARIDVHRVGDALSRLRGLAELSKATLDSAKEPIEGTKAGQAMDRLRPLLRRKKAWLEPDLLPELVGLKPAEQEIFSMLQGQDVLLRSQGVLRIAARVAGSKSAETNRLTDGRINLSRLVGSGQDAALRMGALRLLAVTHCTIDESDCGACPLAPWCRSARRVPAARSPV